MRVADALRRRSFSAVLLLAACNPPAAEQATPPGATAGEEHSEADPVVCERVKEPGRLTGKRVCRRRSEERAKRDEAQHQLRNLPREPPPIPEGGGGSVLSGP